MPANTPVSELDRTRILTTHFRDFQGLVLVPWGALFAIHALFRGGDLAPLIVGAPIAVALSLLARRYYRGRFGQVRQPSRPGVQLLWTLGTLVGAVAAWSALGIAHHLLGGVLSPFGFEGLVIAALFLVVSWPRWRMAPYYPAMAAVIALAALLPLGWWLGGPHPFAISLTEGANYLSATAGAGLVVGGLLDHLVLARSLRPAHDDRTDPR
ncbi:hypothetical protein [Allonocardiopsis opalescens]|uniref:Uncharacterized protein n=1 Tax=Allonocardiopsis opalescens TaxID=1144618 RepID=A0A2T0PU54_9ACTN|nr:hypothetical protein [Allonocardiopsis opalescens]PRX92424.1 hypothetical protein CLV72_110184 [Allonocardiopsis opalescens]